MTERYVVTLTVDVHDKNKIITHAKRLMTAAGALRSEIDIVGVENALVATLIADPDKTTPANHGIEIIERWAISKDRLSKRR
jgi:hypothetical protein